MNRITSLSAHRSKFQEHSQIPARHFRIGSRPAVIASYLIIYTWHLAQVGDDSIFYITNYRSGREGGERPSEEIQRTRTESENCHDHHHQKLWRHCGISTYQPGLDACGCRWGYTQCTSHQDSLSISRNIRGPTGFSSSRPIPHTTARVDHPNVIFTARRYRLDETPQLRNTKHASGPLTELLQFKQASKSLVSSPSESTIVFRQKFDGGGDISYSGV
ncbi:hypothetical protein Hypma_014484 [Hypsizygus marmoreus]|uniref:Uncharacterized protein n=1 Tax=Hypsizygus marmoreus TaxID=39966 RepID=A0A369J9Y9_HYPMA|nr:hypothetical protein Hypma_014484 [Hypsizygus marmoreus]